MKKVKPFLIIGLIMLVGLIGTLYLAVKIAKLPINLPLMSAESIVYDPIEGKNIAEQWKNVVIYEYANVPETVEEIVDSVEVESETDDTVITDYSELIDTETLRKYIDENPSSVENGYEKLFIDAVDKESTPTGIKTIHNDDVLAIDRVNGITILGVNIPYGEDKIAKAKVAIIDNKQQLDMSIVEDLKYWDLLSEHVSRERAILGINANGYTWNDTGDWATMYGLAKYHGQVYRKSANSANTIAFDKDGNMTIGTDVDEAWNATEYYPTLIKDGETVYSVENDPEASIRMAQTAIGQTLDGKTIMVVVSGGIYGSNSGAVTSEVLSIMEKYDTYNASMLSGGSRSVMYWNNRIISLSEGYKEEGVLLPTALVVKPITIVE